MPRNGIRHRGFDLSFPIKVASRVPFACLQGASGYLPRNEAPFRRERVFLGQEDVPMCRSADRRSESDPDRLADGT